MTRIISNVVTKYLLAILVAMEQPAWGMRSISMLEKSQQGQEPQGVQVQGESYCDYIM
jgi:hypothetical protein